MAVFQHYASGDLVLALRAPLDLSALPSLLAERLANERSLAAKEIELLRERVRIMGGRDNG